MVAERLDSYGRTAGIAGSVIALAIWAGINVQVGETGVLISTSLFILLPALLALFSTMIRHVKLLLVLVSAHDAVLYVGGESSV